jgi:hypothetical protein
MFYIVALPVIEVLISMIRRYAYGHKNYKTTREKIKMMMMPDNRHMHHRLINKGYSHERALFFLILFAVFFALCSILLAVSQNSVVKVVVLLYSIYVLFRIIDYLDFEKSFLKMRDKKMFIEKYIFIYTNDKCFEESVFSATSGDYLIEKFETVHDEYKKKNIESFIIYNENSDLIDRDVNKIYEIRELFNTAIFFISAAENLSKYSHIFEREKNVYFVQKPCDITVLIHNIENISYSGSISGNTLFNLDDQGVVKYA